MSEVLKELIVKWIQANAPTADFISKPSEEEYEDIKGYIPEALKAQFKVFCTQRKVTMCAALYYLITEWVKAETKN